MVLIAGAGLWQARPAAPPVQSVLAGSYRIVLGTTPLARAARRLGGTVAGSRACFVSRDRQLMLVLQATGSDGTVTAFSIAPAESAEGCTRLGVRGRALETGQGLRVGRLRADVQNLLGAPARDSAGVAIYRFRGAFGAAAAGRAAATASGDLLVSFRGDTVSAIAGSLLLTR